ncbi:MAG: hypothetical protein GY830_09055 [Bacteroidetes bacterium]|nr:hypothetical protein [Bacteroidota bacterium]
MYNINKLINSKTLFFFLLIIQLSCGNKPSSSKNQKTDKLEGKRIYISNEIIKTDKIKINNFINNHKNIVGSISDNIENILDVIACTPSQLSVGGKDSDVDRIKMGSNDYACGVISYISMHGINKKTPLPEKKINELIKNYPKNPTKFDLDSIKNLAKKYGVPENNINQFSAIAIQLLNQFNSGTMPKDIKNLFSDVEIIAKDTKDEIKKSILSELKSKGSIMPVLTLGCTSNWVTMIGAGTNKKTNKLDFIIKQTDGTIYVESEDAFLNKLVFNRKSDHIRFYLGNKEHQVLRMLKPYNMGNLEKIAKFVTDLFYISGLQPKTYCFITTK